MTNGSHVSNNSALVPPTHSRPQLSFSRPFAINNHPHKPLRAAILMVHVVLDNLGSDSDRQTHFNRPSSCRTWPSKLSVSESYRTPHTCCPPPVMKNSEQNYSFPDPIPVRSTKV